MLHGPARRFGGSCTPLVRVARSRRLARARRAGSGRDSAARRGQPSLPAGPRPLGGPRDGGGKHLAQHTRRATAPAGHAPRRSKRRGAGQESRAGGDRGGEGVGGEVDDDAGGGGHDVARPVVEQEHLRGGTRGARRQGGQARAGGKAPGYGATLTVLPPPPPPPGAVGGVHARPPGSAAGCLPSGAGPAAGWPGGRSGPAWASEARPGARRPGPGCGDGVVARCSRPRHIVGSQPGQIGWRLGRRAALGRQHNRDVPGRGALTQRDARVPRLPPPGDRRRRPGPAPSP